MKQGDKLLKRLEKMQKDEGKAILVSIQIFVGETGEPSYWFVHEYKRAEG